MPYTRSIELPIPLLLKRSSEEDDLNYIPSSNMLLWAHDYIPDTRDLSGVDDDTMNLFLNISKFLTEAYATNLLSLIQLEHEPGYYLTDIIDSGSYLHLARKYLTEEQMHYVKHRHTYKRL